MNRKDENLEVVRFQIEMHEEAICRLPKPVVELYNAGRDGELAILQKEWQSELLDEKRRDERLLKWLGWEWKIQERVLTQEEYVEIIHFMIAAAFLASWYHLGGNKAKRDYSDNASGFIICAFNFEHMRVIQKYAEYRIACENIIKTAGVAPCGSTTLA